MNGYLSPCSGDTHPPIFRSPVVGMEDILANEVICVIYRLPDPHKHITYPPDGVIFPKMIVDQSDLKPDPVLWHEESGRRPWENNRRNNTPGSIAGRQLGEASHRLVANSLQQRGDRNGYGNHMHARPPYIAASRGPPLSSYSNGLHNQGPHGMLRPRMDYSHAGYPRSTGPRLPPHRDHEYVEPYAFMLIPFSIREAKTLKPF